MIKQISTIQTSIPLETVRPFPIWVDEYENQLYVQTQSDENFGYGQILTSALNISSAYVSFVEAFRDSLIGKDEEKIKTHSEKMFRLIFNGGYGVTTGAIGGIDMSLWDLLSRKRKTSLANYLGSKNENVVRYASLPRYRDSKDTINVIEKLFNNGYKKIKLHQNYIQSLEVLKVINGMYDNLDVMVDLSCTLSEKKAIKFLNEVSKYEVKYVEEPVFPPNDYKLLKRLNRIHPVAGGENVYTIKEFQYCMENEVFSVLQPDLSKIGGVTKALEILKLAKALKLPISFHSRPDNGWVQVAASAQVASLYGDLGSVESPPNIIPKQYFNSELGITPNLIQIRGQGIGLSLKEGLPAPNRAKFLVV